MWRSIIPLSAIGGLCGLLLVVVADITEDPIRQNRDAAARSIYADLLDAPLPEDIDVNAAELGNCQSWRMARLSEAGYAATIELVGLWRPVGAQAEPAISMRTLRHLETPGIGDFIDLQISPWMAQLDGSSPSAWAEVDNVTGATVTTQAIRKAVAGFATRMQVQCRRTVKGEAS